MSQYAGGPSITTPQHHLPASSASKILTKALADVVTYAKASALSSAIPLLLKHGVFF